MEVNNQAVLAEITDAFWRYTNALIANDVAIVKEMFWDSEYTLRYGKGESLYGKDAIATFRDGQKGRPLTIDVTRLIITAFGQDFGTANCEMKIQGIEGITRMSHSWVRVEEGWRIVAAQVSDGPTN
tara:strand:+ start:1868 stop:2248 length:381 start_codon:yes stop_codon:yes gene_type:complete